MEFVETEAPRDENLAKIVVFPRRAARGQRRLGQRMRRLAARFRGDRRPEGQYGALQVYRPNPAAVADGSAARQL